MIKGWLDADGKPRNASATSPSPTIATSARTAAAATPSAIPWTSLDAGYRNSDRRCGARTAIWRDPDFDPPQRAFYYVRVLEIPTPRWTTFDAKFFGVEHPEGGPGRDPGARLHLADLVYAGFGDVRLTGAKSYGVCCTGLRPQAFMSAVAGRRLDGDASGAGALTHSEPLPCERPRPCPAREIVTKASKPFALGCLLIGLATASVAQDDAGQSLDQAANDPTASLMNVQIQDIYTGDYHKLDGADSNSGLLWGLFNQNLFSFAGDGDRDDVDVSIIQPILSYSLPKHWSVGTSEMNITYDWNENDWVA